LNAGAPAFQPRQRLLSGASPVLNASASARPSPAARLMDAPDRSMFMTKNITSYFETNTKSLPKNSYQLKEHFYLLSLPDVGLSAHAKKDHTLHELSKLIGLDYEITRSAFPFLAPKAMSMFAPTTTFPTLDFPPAVSNYFKQMASNSLLVHNPLSGEERPPSAMLQYLQAFFGIYQKLYLILENMRTTMRMTRTFYQEFHLLTNGFLYDPFTADPALGSRAEFKTQMPLNVVFMNQFFAFRSMNMIFENFKYHFESYYSHYLKTVNPAEPSPPGLIPIKLDHSLPSSSSSVPMEIAESSSCLPQVNLSAMSISDDESEDSDSRASREKYSSVVAGIQTNKALSKRAKRKQLKAQKTVTLQELQRQQIKLEAQIKEQREQMSEQIHADEILAKTLAEEY
jgi:hypothetical protein